MTVDPTESALRRALHEVADTTPSAHRPPELRPGRPSQRRPRLVLAVAAAVVVLAGVAGLALAADGGDDDELDLAIDGETTTTDPSTTTSGVPRTTIPASQAPTTVPTTVGGVATDPPPTPSTTHPAPVDPGVLLASGAGWEVRRTDDGCARVLVEGVERARDCDRAAPASLTSAGTPGGRLQVVWSRTMDGATIDTPPYGDLGIIPDPGGAGSWLISDQSSGVVVLRRGEDWVGWLSGDRLVHDGPAFAGFTGYTRTNGSLSYGEFQEIGAHRRDGRDCVVARRVDGEPTLIADVCLPAGGRIAAVLTPTPDPTLWDLFGVTTAAGDTWACETDAGTACGSDDTAPVPGRDARTISYKGPVSLGSAGSVTITVGDAEVVVPVPRG